MEKGYSLVQVAEIFGVTRQTVLNWVNTGYIHAIKTKRQFAVMESEIERIKKEGGR